MRIKWKNNEKVSFFKSQTYPMCRTVSGFPHVLPNISAIAVLPMVSVNNRQLDLGNAGEVDKPNFTKLDWLGNPNREELRVYLLHWGERPQDTNLHVAQNMSKGKDKRILGTEESAQQGREVISTGSHSWAQTGLSCLGLDPAFSLALRLLRCRGW